MIWVGYIVYYEMANACKLADLSLIFCVKIMSIKQLPDGKMPWKILFVNLQIHPALGNNSVTRTF